MRKPDLLEFIEKIKEKAVKSVEERYDKKIKTTKDNAMKKYDEKIAMYQDSFNRFVTNVTNLVTDMKEDIEVAYDGSYAIQNGFCYLKNIRESIIDSCEFKGEVQMIKDSKDRELDEVKKAYNTVYAVCKSMNSANRIAEYLEELGFDISSVKDKNMTALVAQVDKSKLFVCGDKK